MNGSSNNAEEFLERLTEITKANLTNSQFGVSELAREMGMSRSNLHLRVKKLTKASVSQFINRVRLKKALGLLKQESFTVSEAAFECGFNSVTYFTKCFGDYYGYPPSEAGKHDETEEIPVDLIEGLAFILLQNGQTKKADSAFFEAIKNPNHPHKIIIYLELFVTNIRLASVYSAMKEKKRQWNTCVLIKAHISLP